MHIQHLPVPLQVNFEQLLSPLNTSVFGSIIAILFVALYVMFKALGKKDESHKEERAEWRRDTLMQYDIYNKTTQEVVQDFKEALKQNSYDLRQDREKFNDSLNKCSELLGTLKAKLEK